MGIITNLKINKELSKKYADIFEGDISQQCYANVMRIIRCLVDNGIVTEDFEVAYGYYGNPSIRMYRHCFLIFKKTIIIDPTSYNIIYDDSEYHIFKKFNIKEYMYAINDFYKTRQPNESPWMEYMIPEEQLYYDYVVYNSVCIDEFSYNNFLEKYDKDKKVFVVNEETAKLLNFKFDTTGKVLNRYEVEALKDGTNLWIETNVPMLAVKEGFKINSLSGEPIFSIKDIEILCTAKEYLSPKS